MHSTKSAIAPSGAHQSFTIPNNWDTPKFKIGDRVTYYDRHCLMTCTVRGMEYFGEVLPDYMGPAPDSGWYYYLLPDPNPTIQSSILADTYSQPIEETEIYRI